MAKLLAVLFITAQGWLTEASTKHNSPEKAVCSTCMPNVEQYKLFTENKSP